ncbi:MAG: DUF5916 domain-containing protein [Bacteroidota bacterium]
MKNILLVVLILLMPLIAFAAGGAGNQKVVLAYKIKDLNIALDGKLTESIWKNPAVKEFVQRDPNEGAPATEPTEVWVAYDESNLYVAARLHDSHPNLIDASLARRDSRINSDWFTLYIDPYNDKKTGYYFAVNAGGTQSDGVLYNDSWDDDSWDGVWEAKTAIDSDGWVVEMKIPFSQLRFNSSKEMTWGVNFERNIKRNKEADYLIMVPKKESGFVSRFALLEGLNGIQPKQRLEVLPYIVQKAQYLVHDANDPFYKSNQYKTTIGADVKIGLGSNLTLDATFNPDFGQVEVDPAVINLSAFESYFDEKRPFFVEGNNIFMFGIGGANNNWGFNFGLPELFYTRRIGKAPHGSVASADYVDYPSVTNILGAAKLTGKIDETITIGAMSAVTERTFATLFNNGIKTAQQVEPLTHYGVFRAKKEINGGNQGLGLMFTTVNRDLSDANLSSLLAHNAYTFGFDGWTFLDKKHEYVITGAFVGSYVNGKNNFLTKLQEEPRRYFQRPDAHFAKLDSNRTSLAGYYGRIMLNKQNGNFYVYSALGIASPGLEYNDLGFQWMADRINGHLVLGYRWFDPDSTFRRKYIYVSHARSYNFDGNLISNFVWWRVGADFMNYWGIQFVGNYSFKSYSFTATRGGPLVVNSPQYEVSLSTNSDSRQKVILQANAVYAKDEIGGVGVGGEVDIEWRPNSQIDFSIGPSFQYNHDTRQWVGNFFDPTAVNTYNNRYVFATINQKNLAANIRLNWTFTPTLSLQLFMQPFFAVGSYNDFKELARPATSDVNLYGADGSTISYDQNSNAYNVDPDGKGPAPVFQISNPDFNYKSLRGTAVLRWEVLPGSIFYFVWSHNQANFDNPGDFNLGRDFKNLWRTDGDNVFLVKFSYWFNM